MVDRESSLEPRTGSVLMKDRMTFVILWWLISARKWFKGPVINIEHAMLGGEGVILEGMEHDLEHLSDSNTDSKKAIVQGLPALEYNNIESQ
jgi:hypothetical protein